MMEQRGRGVKRWANFLPVMREENIPLARNRRAKRSTPHPFGSRAAYRACRRCSRHFHRMERKEETCDAAKQ